MPFTVISYYTDNYKPYNDRLTASCAKFKLPIVSTRVKNRGNWYQTVARKPQIIFDMLTQLNTDILYTDADSEFMADPVLFREWDNRADVGVHIWNQIVPATGTIYLCNTPEVIELVETWCYIMDAIGYTLKCPDQTSFAGALACDKVSISNIPAEYCWIDIASQREHGKRDPVIFHHQASRMHRHHGWAELDNEGIARLAANIDQAGEME